MLLLALRNELQLNTAIEVRAMDRSAEDLLRFVREVAEPTDIVTEGSVVGARIVVEFPEEELLRTYSEATETEELKKYRRVAGLVRRVIPRTVPSLWGVEIMVETENVIMNVSISNVIRFLREVEWSN